MTNDAEQAIDHNSSEYWSQRYQTGNNQWDLGKETAVFKTLLDTSPYFSQPPEQPFSVLIPGCGFGHDAIAFAQRGFEVTALDFAPEPLEYLAQQARMNNVRLNILERDVFTLSWDLPSSFDIVIEYACYCAIDPARRQEYANVLASTLKPGGIVAGLFFPMDEVVRTSPPFSVHDEEIHQQFEKAGFVLVSSELPRESHPARAGRERLMIFRKRV